MKAATALTALAAVLAPSLVSAQVSLVHQNVSATYVYRQEWTLEEGKTYTFRTDVDPGKDTVLYLWSNTEQKEIDTTVVRSSTSPGPFRKLENGCYQPGNFAYAERTEFMASPLAAAGVAAAEFTVSGTTYLYRFSTTTGSPTKVEYVRTTALSGSWSTATDLGGSFRSDAQPAAEVFDGKLHVFAVSGSTTVQYATIDSSGNASTWQTVSGIPGGVGDIRDVSLAVYGGKLYAVFRDLNDLTDEKSYIASMTTGGSWSTWQEVSDGAAPITCNTTPAIAAGPDSKLYMACGDTTHSNRLALYASTGSSWTNITAQNVDYATQSLGSYTSDARPAMVYVHHLDASATALANSRGYLAIYYHHREIPTTYPGFLYPFTFWANSWGTFTASSRDVRFGAPMKVEANGFVRTYIDAGGNEAAPALARRGERLVALITAGPGNDNKAFHIPYADNIGPAAPSSDVDDGAIMVQYLCKSLNTGCENLCDDFNGLCNNSGSNPEEVGPCLMTP